MFSSMLVNNVISGLAIHSKGLYSQKDHLSTSSKASKKVHLIEFRYVKTDLLAYPRNTLKGKMYSP